MDILDTEKAALTKEYNSIKARLEKAVAGEKAKLASQYDARLAHLEARLEIKPPEPAAPASAPTPPAS